MYGNPIRSVALVCLLGTLMLFPVGEAAAQSCSGDARIDVTLPLGSRWDLCWESREKEGVVLSDVYFSTPAGVRRRVLTELGLAQVHLRFDDGSPVFDALTDTAAGGGFGANGNIVPLSAGDCGGSLLSQGGTAILCSDVRRRGYAYKSYSVVKQGHALVLESRSQVGLSTFVVRWKLYDDGSIEPAIGLTGELPALGNDARYGWELDQSGRVGVGFHASVHWRLDFDIGSNAADDLVEQIEVTPSSDRARKTLSVSTVSSEASRSVNPDVKRSWRVRDTQIVNADSRPISYHLEALHTANAYPTSGAAPWQIADLHVTRFRACERFVNANPATNGCATDVTGFTNGESIAPGNVVLWYRINYHHVPRSEDEPVLPVRWNGFLIVPRDWTSVNPLAALPRIDSAASRGAA